VKKPSEVTTNSSVYTKNTSVRGVGVQDDGHQLC